MSRCGLPEAPQNRVQLKEVSATLEFTGVIAGFYGGDMSLSDSLSLTPVTSKLEHASACPSALLGGLTTHLVNLAAGLDTDHTSACLGPT